MTEKDTFAVLNEIVSSKEVSGITIHYTYLGGVDGVRSLKMMKQDLVNYDPLGNPNLSKDSRVLKLEFRNKRFFYLNYEDILNIVPFYIQVDDKKAIVNSVGTSGDSDKISLSNYASLRNGMTTYWGDIQMMVDELIWLVDAMMIIDKEFAEKFSRIVLLSLKSKLDGIVSLFGLGEKKERNKI